MLPKRTTRTDSHSSFTASERNLILAAETLRSGESTPTTAAPESAKPEEKISVFWRVFGGTILSIVALIVVNAYQSIGANIHELRSDMNRMRESAGDFIKKDDFNNRQTTVWTSVREAQALAAPVTVLTSKIGTFEQQLATADKERREIQTSLGQLAMLRDQVASLHEQRKVSESDHKELTNIGAVLQSLRDRDSTLEKLIKDAEAERRELTRELQAFRERLAKFEGQQAGKSKD